MKVMKGWMVGVMVFFSINIMAQTSQNYKQQFTPSAKKEVVDQQKYYEVTEGKMQYHTNHNYKNNFSKSNEGSAVFEDCDRHNVYKLYSINVEDTSCQELEGDLSRGAFIDPNYKRTFSGRKN